MTARYPDGPGAGRPSHSYTCAFYQVNYGTGGSCQHIAGPALDAYIAGQVLDAVAPAALEVSMAAAALAEDERAALDKLWRQRLERARYAADRARRQYQLAEPENRLVTRQLEAEWERHARRDGEAGSGLPAVHRTAAGCPDRGRAGGDPVPGRRPPARLARLDDHAGRPQGTAAHPDPGHHRQRRRGQRARRRHHHLAGGHQTSGQAVRPVARTDQLSYFPALLERVTGLAGTGHNSRQIADVLNAEGYRPPKRTDRFTSGRSAP